MKTDTLESFLLDRALGELSPDVKELVDAYLEQNPSLAFRADALAQTTLLARASLAATSTSDQQRNALPTPVVGTPWRLHLPERFGDMAKLAACLALGAAAGWTAERWTDGVRNPTLQHDLPVAVRTVETVRPSVTTNEFWSVAALANAEPARPAVDRMQRAYRLRWESPGRMPHLEENP